MLASHVLRWVIAAEAGLRRRGNRERGHGGKSE
jgi:hypothetical protein